jgi:hypothetical protein
MQMTPNQNKPAQLNGSLTLSFVLHTHRISADGLNAGANHFGITQPTATPSDNLKCK